MDGRYDCLQTTAANTIDGLRSHLIRKTGFESDLTARIHAVARLQNIADNDICDIFGGKARQNRLGCDNAQVNRRTVFQGPLESPNCRALCCCDNKL